VLLFFVFMLGHPLKGKRELTLAYDPNDPDMSRRLCEDDPVFVYDPDNDSNRPVQGEHDPLLAFWPIYPASLRKLFIRAFTHGLHEPEGRVMENEWRKEMSDIRDSIFHCDGCTAENFFDVELVRQKKSMNPCWSCGRRLENPPRMRVGSDFDPQLVVLSAGAQLFPHHLEGDAYNFGCSLGEVTTGPLALHNLSSQPWTARAGNGSLSIIGKGGTLSINADCQISFGKVEGRVRIR